jgi:fatty acid desaturase
MPILAAMLLELALPQLLDAFTRPQFVYLFPKGEFMQYSQPLPTALLGDKNKLSPKGRKELNSLSRRSPRAFLTQLLLAWLTIFTVIAIAVKLNTIWISMLAIIVVATRQNILALLVHEQAHCLGFKSKLGDLFANLFVAYPLLIVTVEGYAQIHLSHHRFYFTDKDPDILRKTGPEWTFPMPMLTLLKLFVTDLFGLNLYKFFIGKQPSKGLVLYKRPMIVPGWVRPCYYLIFAAILSWTGAWTIFLFYWVLPLITVFQAIVRWGALCEHQYIPSTSVVESSPIIEPLWFEKLILPNLNFNLHPYHHFCPGIPFDNLPKAHAIFQREGLIDESNVFKGYGAYFWYLVGGRSKLG